MRTRAWIGLFTIAAVLFAGHEHDLAAIYAAIAWGAISFHLHAIEVKINRLLDYYRIIVPDNEIAKD